MENKGIEIFKSDDGQQYATSAKTAQVRKEGGRALPGFFYLNYLQLMLAKL
jgi:hypothetical protein